MLQKLHVCIPGLIQAARNLIQITFLILYNVLELQPIRNVIVLRMIGGT